MGWDSDRWQARLKSTGDRSRWGYLLEGITFRPGWRLSIEDQEDPDPTAPLQVVLRVDGWVCRPDQERGAPEAVGLLVVAGQRFELTPMRYRVEIPHRVLASQERFVAWLPWSLGEAESIPVRDWLRWNGRQVLPSRPDATRGESGG